VNEFLSADANIVSDLLSIKVSKERRKIEESNQKSY